MVVLAVATAECTYLQGDMEAAQARIYQLQEELASKEGQLRNKINANELQLKEQIVYNVSAVSCLHIVLHHTCCVWRGCLHRTRLFCQLADQGHDRIHILLCCC